MSVGVPPDHHSVTASPKEVSSVSVPSTISPRSVVHSLEDRPKSSRPALQTLPNEGSVSGLTSESSQVSSMSRTNLDSSVIARGPPTRNHVWSIDAITGRDVLVRKPRSRGVKRDLLRNTNQRRLTNLAQRLGSLPHSSPMSDTRYAAHQRLGPSPSFPSSQPRSSYQSSQHFWGNRGNSNHASHRLDWSHSTSNELRPFWPNRQSSYYNRGPPRPSY